MFSADLLSPTEALSLMNLSGVNDSAWGGWRVLSPKALFWVSQPHESLLNSLAIANSWAALTQETVACYTPLR